MKYWTEFTNDAFSCFEWFSKDEANKNIGYIPNLSVFSIIGTMILSTDDRELFLSLCSRLVTGSTVDKAVFNEHRFYLFGVVETDNLNSKIFKYQKLWGKLKREYNLDNLTLGPEVEYIVDERLCYASIAEFNVADIYKVIQIISSNPQKYTIIGSKGQDYKTERFIKTLLEKVYIDGDKEGEIDYFKLSLVSCPKGDLVFRWGSSSEEYELDIFTLEENKRLFDDISFKS
ncbi:hypothetical protein [Exiguobacterium algae]|uniref:hypothetical protein n=1 Tax=Exiguobacterium algae TaxID=2751250 RepID=UPI001BEBF678|nr:hypothetical protein [Exiguobacterium algae]